LDCFLRLLAGSGRTTLSHICKMRGRQPWKLPLEYTDLERHMAVCCPCGLGIQDSVHFLSCKHRSMIELRHQVVASASEVIDEERKIVDGGWKPYTDLMGVVKRQRYKKAKTVSSEQITRTVYDLHREEIHSWDHMTQTHKCLLTLGKSDTALTTRVRTKLVTLCLPLWAKVEYMWEIINS
jgi:hypothetical protein